MKNYFAGIIGHEAQLKVLARQIEMKKLSHAYLFVGRPHLGKTEIALRFIGQVLNLKEKEKIASHPDVRILGGEEMIKVDEIRALKNHLVLKPYWGDYKITLVPQAERMNRVAANAFLKILEEPPGENILILTSHDEASLLPTIVSRCELIKFYSAKQEEIKKFLVQKGLTTARAELITRLAQGRPGLTFRYLEKPERLKKELGQIQSLVKLKKNSLASRFNFAKQYLSQNPLEDILRVWLALFRDMLLAKNNCPDQIIYSLVFPDILNLSQKYTTQEISNRVRLIQKILRALKNNINRRLALEVLLLNI